MDVDSSNDDSTSINSVRRSVIKINKPDIYNRERNGLED